MRSQRPPSLSRWGLYFKHLIEQVYLLLQVVKLQEKITVLLVVESLLECAHVLVLLHLLHLQELGEVGVIRALLEVAGIRTADRGSHRLRVTLVVSVDILEHLHQLRPLIHIAILIGSLELEDLLLSPP